MPLGLELTLMAVEFYDSYSVMTVAAVSTLAWRGHENYAGTLAATDEEARKRMRRRVSEWSSRRIDTGRTSV